MIENLSIFNNKSKQENIILVTNEKKNKNSPHPKLDYNYGNLIF